MKKLDDVKKKKKRFRKRRGSCYYLPVPILSSLAVLLNQLLHITTTDGTQIQETVLDILQPLKELLGPLEQLAKAVGIAVHDGRKHWVLIHLIHTLPQNTWLYKHNTFYKLSRS